MPEPTKSQPHDWKALAASPEFDELTRRRGRFITVATLASLAWFFCFILLSSYATELMATPVYEGLTIAYLLGLSQFVMVWGVTWLYLRRSRQIFAPLERAVGGGRPS